MTENTEKTAVQEAVEEQQRRTDVIHQKSQDLCNEALALLKNGVPLHTLCVMLTPNGDGLSVRLCCTDKAMLPAFAAVITERAAAERESVNLTTAHH